MKFISVVALLAPVVLAAPQAGFGSNWISLIKEKCPDMPEQCVAVAEKAHQPLILDVAQLTEALPACTAPYGECIHNIAPDISGDVRTSLSQAELVTCIHHISPDHFKYFLDNDSAEIPIPASQNCMLRELHRAAHVELGPLA